MMTNIFCPGYRIGWIAGVKDIISKYVLVKQGADLQCNIIAQMEIAKFLELYDIDAHIEKIRVTYKRRRDIMMETMKESFPEGVIFTKPQGGLFAWVELPAGMNARELLDESLKQKVAFVPDGSFFPNGAMKIHYGLIFQICQTNVLLQGFNGWVKYLRALLNRKYIISRCSILGRTFCKR